MLAFTNWIIPTDFTNQSETYTPKFPVVMYDVSPPQGETQQLLKPFAQTA
jgi:hypothetical protein